MEGIGPERWRQKPHGQTGGRERGAQRREAEEREQERRAPGAKERE